MASSLSSTSLSNTEKDLTSENIGSSASDTGQKEMEDDTSRETLNVRLNARVINGASPRNLSPSNSCSRFVQLGDDDYKTSVSVDDETDAIIKHGHAAEKKILGVIENKTSSISTPSDQDFVAINSRSISEVDGAIDSGGVEPCITPLTHLPEPQVNAATTDNSQHQSQKKKHIMISYNQATASIISRKIYDRLKDRDYNVWLDKVDLHGSITDGMGDAVENSYVLLLCMNNGYSNSAFATAEAKYAFEKKIPVIPCIMEKAFRACGGLGIIKSDLKHIEFFCEDKFDESFEQLIAEIDYIEEKLGMRSVPIPLTRENTCRFSSKTTMPSSSINDVDFQDHLNVDISELIVAIKKSPLRRNNLNENEFGQVLHKVIQEFSPETLQSFQQDQSDDDDDDERQKQERNNDRLMQRLLKHDERFAELARIQQEQQENDARNRSHLLDHDERLAAFVRFQQKQEQKNADFAQRHLNQSEQLASLIRVQKEQQQDYAYLQQQFSNKNEQATQISHRQQERNDHIAEQLLLHVEKLTQLVVNQEQQHARDTEALHLLINRSLDNNESLTRTIDQRWTPPGLQQRQEDRFNFDLFNKLVQTIILLWTLITLLRNK